MSRNINVNPGNYKVAGRERQGEAIDQSSQKGAYAQQRQEVRRGAMEAEAGPPAWETTPPNLEITDRPAPPARKRTQPRKRTHTRKRTQMRKRAQTRTGARKQTRKTAAPKSKKTATRRR